jgi:ATP-binding cassette, subfamily C (CFTR/MRP), member 1
MGWGCMTTGVKVRAAITDAVCSKAFIMESVTKETITDVVTFVASDINKVYEGMQEFHYLWTAPLEAFTILALLASLTKQFAAPGVGVMMIVLPLQYYFGYLIAKNKYTNYKNTQAR